MKKVKSKSKTKTKTKTKSTSLKKRKPKSNGSEMKKPKKKVFCEFCGAEIPPERLEILPDTTTCVQCSQTKPYSEAQIIGLNGEEAENRLNVEDFEETDTDFSISYNDQW
jgi:RNA polymerase-binding transcription factor DksA